MDQAEWREAGRQVGDGEGCRRGKDSHSLLLQRQALPCEGGQTLSRSDQAYVAKKRDDLRNNLQRYALLIGVNRYAKPIRSLRFCAKDMKTLAESFQKVGVPEENIFS